MKIIEDPIPLLFGENLKNCFQPYFILNIGSPFQLYIRAIFNTAAALIRSRQNPPIMHESPACYTEIQQNFRPPPPSEKWRQKEGGGRKFSFKNKNQRWAQTLDKHQRWAWTLDKHQRWAFKIKLQDVRTPTIPLLCCVHKRQ